MAQPALFVMPSASGGCLVRQLGNGGKLIRVRSLVVVDGDARLPWIALAEEERGLVSVEGEANRDKIIRTYFAANLNQKSDHAIVTYEMKRSTWRRPHAVMVICVMT